MLFSGCRMGTKIGKGQSSVSAGPRPCRWSRSRLTEHRIGKMPPKKDTQPSGNSRHGSFSRTSETDNQSDDTQSETPRVDSHILVAIKQAVREVRQHEVVQDRWGPAATGATERADAERSMQFTSDRLESAVTTLLPAITAQMSQLAEGLAHRQLELEFHRKKWNLVIHGVEGTEKGDEAVTRQVCRSFAKEVLRVEDADATVFAACDRLSTKRNTSWTLHSVTNGCWVPRTLKTITRKYQFLPTYHLSLNPPKMNFCRNAPSYPCRLNKSLGQSSFHNGHLYSWK